MTLPIRWTTSKEAVRSDTYALVRSGWLTRLVSRSIAYCLAVGAAFLLILNALAHQFTVFPWIMLPIVAVSPALFFGIGAAISIQFPDAVNHAITDAGISFLARGRGTGTRWDQILGYRILPQTGDQVTVQFALPHGLVRQLRLPSGHNGVVALGYIQAHVRSLGPAEWPSTPAEYPTAVGVALCASVLGGGLVTGIIGFLAIPMVPYGPLISLTVSAAALATSIAFLSSRYLGVKYPPPWLLASPIFMGIWLAGSAFTIALTHRPTSL